MTLIVKNLSKSFGTQLICRNFNLMMQPGDLTLLVGESGSGKTTILRMLNALETADQGTIELAGYDLISENGESSKTEQKNYQRAIGLVFQDYQLFPQMTVLENLLFAPKVNKLAPQKELTAAAISWLERFGLANKCDVYPSTLSGGQKQRVAIIRAMMMRPQLLCFDEPTSALDPANTLEFSKLIEELRREGVMVLIVTHDMTLVELVQENAQIITNKEFIQSN